MKRLCLGIIDIKKRSRQLVCAIFGNPGAPTPAPNSRQEAIFPPPPKRPQTCRNEEGGGAPVLSLAVAHVAVAAPAPRKHLARRCGYHRVFRATGDGYRPAVLHGALPGLGAGKDVEPS